MDDKRWKTKEERPRKDGEMTSRKSVATPVCKLHRIGANGRACGGYLPVVARNADDDDDEYNINNCNDNNNNNIIITMHYLQRIPSEKFIT